MEFTQEIFDRINSFDSLKAGWKAIADETGNTVISVKNNYYKFKEKNKINYSFSKNKKAQKDKEIIEEIAKHPDNIQEACRIVAQKQGVSSKTISALYYGRIKNNPDYPIFTIMSKKSGHMNVKNNISNKYTKYKTNHSFIEQTWGKIKYFINNILK